MKTLFSIYATISMISFAAYASSLLGGYSCTDKKSTSTISGRIYVDGVRLARISTFKKNLSDTTPQEKFYSLYTGDAESVALVDFDETDSIYRPIQYYASAISMTKENLELLSQKKAFEMVMLTIETGYKTVYACNRDESTGTDAAGVPLAKL